MSVNSKMTAIADAIREKTGESGTLTLDGMAAAIAGIEAGGDTSMEDGLIARNIGEYRNDRVKKIGECAFYYYDTLDKVYFPLVEKIESQAFYYCSALDAVDFPKVTSIGEHVFNNCKSMTAANFPLATTVGTYAFRYCERLTSVNLPKITKINEGVFESCKALATIEFPLVSSIGKYAFSYCHSLTSLVLRYSGGVCTLSNTNAFNRCHHILGTTDSTYNPNGLKDGYIYVPDTLVDSYKAATNWSTYASQIKPLSEYVEVSA